jgi:hypothetical protein
MADHATILHPFRYVQAIARAFAAQGGDVVRGEVRALAPQDGRWRLQLADAERSFDHAVVAGGAWSRALLDPLGIHLKLETQRGYHVQFTGGGQAVSRTVVLADRKVFVTPMEEGLRVGGTVEIAGLTRAPDMRRAAHGTAPTTSFMHARLQSCTYAHTEWQATRTWVLADKLLHNPLAASIHARAWRHPRVGLHDNVNEQRRRGRRTDQDCMVNTARRAEGHRGSSPKHFARAARPTAPWRRATSGNGRPKR